MEKLNLKLFRSRPKNHIPPFPATFNTDYLASDLSLKEYGGRLTSIIYVFDEKNLNTAVNTIEEYEEIEDFLVGKFKNDLNYLDDLILWSESQKNSLRDYLESSFGVDGKLGKNMSNEQLANVYVEYCEKYRFFHFKNTPAWWVGSDATVEALKEFFTLNELDDSVLHEAIEPLEFQTESAEEDISFMEICKLAKSQKVNQINSVNDLPENLKDLFNNHIRNYTSIPFGYNTGVLWDDSYFINKFNTKIKEDVDFSEILEKNKLDLIRKLEARDTLVKKLSAPQEILTLVESVRKLSYLQELKKTAQTRSHPILQLLVVPEIARRLNVSDEYIRYMSPQEIKASLLEGLIKEDFKLNIKERLFAGVLILKDLKFNWIVGEEAKNFIKINGFADDVIEVKELKGSIACKGFAKGVVKVCNLSTEISKVSDGDILVTAMTTPDFVPAMRKAAGIITDEGGITCHAAIVSRELNKPCIIGTRNATKILKDGDQVELDADNGVVKILDK